MISLLLAFSDVGLLIARIITGCIFIAHGMLKVKDRTQAASFFESMGFIPGSFWSIFIMVLEIAGWVMLIAGLFTQPLALLFCIEMLVTTLWVRRKQGLVGGYEIDLALLAVCVMLLTSGAGAFSVDSHFRIFLY